MHTMGFIKQFLIEEKNIKAWEGKITISDKKILSNNSVVKLLIVH